MTSEPLAPWENQPFLTYYLAGEVEPSMFYGRDDLQRMGAAAALSLRGAALGAGDRFLLCMAGNRPEDLAWRLGASMVGAVPVTVNWQADTVERVRYKLERTGARGIVVANDFVHAGTPDFDEAIAGVTRLGLPDAQDAPLPVTPEVRSDGDLRIIIFTSGTTGEPKPVALSCGAYRANRRVFESFLRVTEDEPLALVVTNPLHHANSTAITDWALGRAGTRLFLFERFSRAFWAALTRIVEDAPGRVVVPAVSRHFDLLESLAATGDLGVAPERLRAALERVTFLVGSAPVGPKTVELFERWTSRLPTVRFGSTELCLQALGIAPDWTVARVKGAFVAGWTHIQDERELGGFFIGRPHPPFTQARMVRSVVPGDEGYMVDVPMGCLGRIIVKSDCMFTGYFGDSTATRSVMDRGWYLGLGDHGFVLESPDDGQLDYFWVGRDAGLMIRGGANYSCQQVASELKVIIADAYTLDPGSFDLAVIGLKLDSDHEDSCCVLLELEGVASSLQERIETEFLGHARAVASKGARPDRVLIGPLPRNFKGALDVRALRRAFVDP